MVSMRGLTSEQIEFLIYTSYTPDDFDSRRNIFERDLSLRVSELKERIISQFINKYNSRENLENFVSYLNELFNN